MSLRQRLFNRGNEDNEDTAPTSPVSPSNPEMLELEDSSGNSKITTQTDAQVGTAFKTVFAGSPPSAYDHSRERKFSYYESCSIQSESPDAEEVNVSICTPAHKMSFTVRVTGYTSRFGTLDVEYISMGGFAMSLYHPIPDSDEYLVRRLFYYSDVGGIGGEKTTTYNSPPMNPVWSRSEDLGETVNFQQENSRVEVYDWRENMLTTGKPTPSDGEVVVQYSDSTITGGGRDEVTHVLTVDDVRSVIGNSITVDYISINTTEGKYNLFGHSDGAWFVGHVPIRKDVSVVDVSWESIQKVRPSKMKNLIWVRDDADTWFVDTN